MAPPKDRYWVLGTFLLPILGQDFGGITRAREKAGQAMYRAGRFVVSTRCRSCGAALNASGLREKCSAALDKTQIIEYCIVLQFHVTKLVHCPVILHSADLYKGSVFNNCAPLPR